MREIANNILGPFSFLGDEPLVLYPMEMLHPAILLQSQRRLPLSFHLESEHLLRPGEKIPLMYLPDFLSEIP